METPSVSALSAFELLQLNSTLNLQLSELESPSSLPRVVQTIKHDRVMTAKSGDSVSPPASASPSDCSKSTQRVPPPESAESIQTRFRVIASFWAVIIFLGFPIWWKTTSIYRAHLPIQEMVDWADGKVLVYSMETAPSLS